ncbi:MAG TPA: FAD-binding and (Fe-S)-binding domain-containing protein [Verrucomicrobiae bacterium]|nr:FAD-binding and (Fe-S)-binding domain-containing protein [Verrucomicrobiae bacterium]
MIKVLNDGAERELRSSIHGEVRFDRGSRALYATDASNYRQIPLGVILPKDASDVERALAIARKHGMPVVNRGGGTSLAGEATNAAVVMDFSKYMNAILELDYDNKFARVQPGCVLDDLRNLAEKRNLTFGPDPATHNHNTLGGMIGNNSCGMHAQMAGKTEANIEEMEIITYDGVRMRVGPTSEDELEAIISAGGRRGEIYAKLRDLRDRYADRIRERFPKLVRRVSGYPIDQLLPENGFNVARALVGTEGTCVTILEAKCRLVHSPPHRALTILGFPDLVSAAAWVPFCDRFGPIALEGMDDSIFALLQTKHQSTAERSNFPDGNAWLMVEFGADSAAEVETKAHELLAAVFAKDRSVTHTIVADPGKMQEMWKVRDSALGITAKVPGQPDTYPGWEDSAVPPDRLSSYLRELQKLFSRYGYHPAVYGHFGQGCVHCRIDFDLFTKEGIQTYRRFVHEAAKLCVDHGGSLSGEHGDGQSRGELLPIMYGDDIVRAFWEFKTIWDPDDKMNPGKVVHPNKLDQNLRWGVDYEPWDPPTNFHLKGERGSFAYAANRCVGAGVCRKHDGGTMCPSYMVTREEQHSTRGRARLLFEMMRGDPSGKTWHDRAVKEALDLCLACKGCKGECPVNVDMATYKAEFLSHYYAGGVRPRNAYAFGLMMFWARIAALAPVAVNALAGAPLLGGLLKRAARMDQRRRIPRFAAQTFRAWFAARAPRNVGKKRVILWPDTWNNHFHPSTAIAAVEVLEDAGFQVTIPGVALCCGRPLYDYGMLHLARKMLEGILEALREEIRAGTPLVGLEPSCVSVFRDEMSDLLGNDKDAERLAKQTYLFSEFLEKYAPEYRPPKLDGKAIVHQHCHHKAILDTSAEKRLFERSGLDYQILDSGCCGMAGAFGFEAGHYDVSVAAGERVLLPNVREAAQQTIVVADGFSCREQIAQMTDRLALHPAQVIKLALDQRGMAVTQPFPERKYMADPRAGSPRSRRRTVATVTAVLSAAALAGLVLLRRRA